MFKTQVLLNEGWELLTEAQQNVLVYSERRLIPILEELSVLFENKLSPDQIESLFAAAEQSANESGNNKTALGKAAAAAGVPFDLAKKLDATIKDVAKKAQDTTPVKNFDAQFEKLKQKVIEKVGGNDAKIVQTLKQYGQWAKENPGKSMLILSLLSAAASVAVGGASAGAAVGFLLKMGNNLIQGEKLSTALGKGAYGAAIGWLSGIAFKWLSDTIIDNIASAKEVDLSNQLDALNNAAREQAIADAAKNFPGVDFGELAETTTLRLSGNINSFYYSYDVILNPEQLQQVNNLNEVMNSTKGFTKEFYQSSAKFHDLMAGFQNSPEQPLLRAAGEALNVANMTGATGPQVTQLLSDWDNLDALYANAKAISPDVANAVQGAVTQAEKIKKGSHKAEPVSDEEKQGQSPEGSEGEQPQQPAQESVYIRHQNKDLELIYERMMQEGLWDDVKGAGARAGQMIGRGVDAAKTKVNQFAQSDTGQKLAGAMKSTGQAAGKAAAATGQAAGKAVGAGLAKAGQIKTNLTTKITKDKLMSAWKKSGSPTDVGSIVNIMQDAGVTPEMMQAVQGQTNIKLPANAFTQPEPQQAPQQAQPKPTQAPQQAQPQQKPSQAFKYSGKSKNVSSVVDKLNSGGIDKAALLKYIQSKKSAA